MEETDKNEVINFSSISENILEDKATGGFCYNVHIKVGEYIRLVSSIYKESNEFQRGIINIKRSNVYTKLVKDLIKGVVIPTISIYFENVESIEKSMVVSRKDIRILDGLQRTNCILYAYDLLKGGSESDEELIKQIKNPISLEDYLNRLIRVEIWTKLTVNGILYKMVSLNAGQTPMRVEHQFEVIELPLLKSLRERGIPIKRGKEESSEPYTFPLSLIVEGSIAYNLGTISPKKQEIAISFLDQLEVYKDQHESIILKSEIFMQDLYWVLEDFHKKQINAYSQSTLKEFAGILAEQDTFFIPFMAALGKARSSKDIEKSKEALISLLNSGVEDPLNLRVFKEISDNFRAGIGMKKRSLVFNAFYFFFRGGGTKIDWLFAKDLI